MKRWTEKNIRQLKDAGKIRGYRFNKRHPKKKGAIAIPPKKVKALVWLDVNIQYWCNERALTLRCAVSGGELKFDPDRKWRFDYAIPALNIAVEYEGGIFQQNSGHNTAKHYTKDTEKYNRAAVLGWRVIRVTALNYKTVLEQLNQLIK